jgi:hypothetical protein
MARTIKGPPVIGAPETPVLERSSREPGFAMAAPVVGCGQIASSVSPKHVWPVSQRDSDRIHANLGTCCDCKPTLVESILKNYVEVRSDGPTLRKGPESDKKRGSS